MLAIFALLVASVFGSTFEQLVIGITDGTTDQAAIMMAVLNGEITMAQVGQLAVLVAQAAAAAAAAAAQEDCSAQPAADRYQTPVINGVVGYGSMCASLPDVYFTNPSVSSDVPDISGTYRNDLAPCPASLGLDGGNELRIEQNGDEIIFIGARVVHHFKKEGADCEAVCSDVIKGCAGQLAVNIGDNCKTGQVTAVPDMENNCWELQAAFVTVRWCKTETGVSRAVNGIMTYTGTLVQ